MDYRNPVNKVLSELVATSLENQAKKGLSESVATSLKNQAKKYFCVIFKCQPQGPNNNFCIVSTAFIGTSTVIHNDTVQN